MQYNRIVLIGFSGSGKSTIGKKLAKRLNYEFIDLDKFIEQTFKLSVTDFFEKYNEEVFRKYEYSALKTALQKEEVIISTGGGTPCFYDSMDLIIRDSISIYIYLSPKSLQKRLFLSKVKRPLIKNKTESELLAYIESTLKTREQFYTRATISVKGENFDLDALVEQIQNIGRK